MRELTVKESENQYDVLVSFLSTLPYVQLPGNLKKKVEKENNIENEAMKPCDINSLGEIDNEPFNADDLMKNYSINWESFHEVISLFKNIPLEKHLEQHTEEYKD
jgi:hypothetical protein